MVEDLQLHQCAQSEGRVWVELVLDDLLDCVPVTRLEGWVAEVSDGGHLGERGGGEREGRRERERKREGRREGGREGERSSEKAKGKKTCNITFQHIQMLNNHTTVSRKQKYHIPPMVI